MQLAADKNASFDFALKNGTVRWSDLSTYQGRMLLPKTEEHDLSKGSDNFFTSCMISCHSFQTRMGTMTRDEKAGAGSSTCATSSWRQGGGRMTTTTVEDIVSYLTTAFGPDSPKPVSCGHA